MLRTTTFNTNTNTITIDPSTDLTDGTYIIYFVVRTAASGGGAGVSIKQVGKFTIDTIAPSFSYTIPYYSLTVGTPITPMSPTPTTTEANPKRSGGYTLKAGYSLPPGLHLNTDTGAITGTPTTAKIRPHITIIVETDKAGNTGEYRITFPAVNASLVTFFPAEGAYVTDNTTNITIAFGLPVVTRSGERITDTNAALNTLINPNINVLTFIDAHTLVTLKKKNGGAGGVGGSDLTTLVNTEFAANSNSNSNPDTITINPAANLADGTYTTRLLSNEANEVITSAGGTPSWVM